MNDDYGATCLLIYYRCLAVLCESLVDFHVMSSFYRYSLENVDCLGGGNVVFDIRFNQLRNKSGLRMD